MNFNGFKEVEGVNKNDVPFFNFLTYFLSLVRRSGSISIDSDRVFARD